MSEIKYLDNNGNEIPGIKDVDEITPEMMMGNHTGTPAPDPIPEPAPAPVVEPTPAEPVTPPTPVVTPVQEPAKTVSSITPIIETEPPAISDDIKVLIEKTGGKIKDWKEIEQLLSPREEMSAEAKAVDEYVKKGGAIKDWLKWNSTDYTAVSDADAIKLKLSLENKRLTSDQIDLIVRKEYNIGNEDIADPEELEYSRTKLIRDADSARQFLLQKQAENKIPETARAQEDQSRALQQQFETYQTEARKSLENYNGFEVKIGDQSFKIQPDATTKARISELTINPQNFMAQFKTPAEFRDYVAKSEMMMHAISLVAGSEREKGKADILDGLQNAHVPKGDQPTSLKPQPKDRFEAMRMAIEEAGLND